MRTSCYDCTRKHLSQAWVNLEAFTFLSGDDSVRALWKTVGHLAEAEDEILQIQPSISSLIRQARLAFLRDQLHPDFPALLSAVSSAASSGAVITESLPVAITPPPAAQLLTRLAQAAVCFMEAFKGYPQYFGLTQAQLSLAADLAEYINLPDLKQQIQLRAEQLRQSPDTRQSLDDLLLTAYNELTSSEKAST